MMGETTGISWCDHTFNPWIGCSKVSAGCTNCYAERDNKRYSWVNGWGVDGERRKTSASNWKKPRAWDAAAKRDGVRRKVFCASLADVFEDRPELEKWRCDLWNLINDTPSLDWLILTKRPENVIAMWLSGLYRNMKLPPNVWMGVTAENQEMADKRIPILLDIQARVRFVSVEPMLEAIDLGDYVWDHDSRDYPVERDAIDWVICGGESGTHARPMRKHWARNLHIQCQAAGTPFFFKQVGGTKRIDGHWGSDLLDGVQYHEFPEVSA